MFLPFFGKTIHACLAQVSCLIEVATKTGFTVFLIHKDGPNFR